MDKIRDILFSELCIAILNIALFIVMIFWGRYLGFIGCTLWVVYLMQSIQVTNSSVMKPILIIFCLIALLLIFLNIIVFVSTITA